MTIASMFLRILAILGAIAAAVMFWVIGDTKDKLEASLQSTQGELSHTQSRLNTVTGEKTELEEQAATLTTNLEETEARATTLNNQLAQVRRELVTAQQAIATRDQETEILRTEAIRIRRELLDERNRVGQLEETLQSEDAATLRASILELEKQLLETERRLGESDPNGTDTSTIASSEAEQTRSVVLRGEVIEVSEASSFIQINLGSAEGVRENSSVMIRRGPRYIGRAHVRDVGETSSIAEVATGAGRIRAGDLAVTLN